MNSSRFSVEALARPSRLQPVLVAMIVVGLGEFLVRFFLPSGFNRPIYGDEVLFRPAWQLLTDSSVSIADRIDGYALLNTPLSIYVFGVAERIGGGLWAPRLVVALCAAAVAMIVVRRRIDTLTSLQAAAGLLVMPHFLRSATVAYTDLVAILFVVLGLLAHDKGRHWPAAIWFILAIASRQYSVAFPVALVLWELWRPEPGVRFRQNPMGFVRRFALPYGVAAATLLGWFAVFGGLVSEAAQTKIGHVPEVQQSLFALDPQAGLFFLSAMGLFFVLPEIVISPATSLVSRRWRTRHTVAVAGVIVTSALFPFDAASSMWGFNELSLTTTAASAVFLALAILGAARFTERSLSAIIVWTHAVMLMKSFPWSKYALPVVVALWLLHNVPISAVRPQPEATAPRRRGSMVAT
ncbi:MAG: hypothetical protein HKN26_08435 [Acidimicrobiales bacterium]|nr:hypothetical protein [Acidimicrobiales bacterium]